MYELCTGASKCLNMNAPLTLLHSINLSSPCILGRLGGNWARDSKVLMCCSRPNTSQLEVRSRDLNESLQRRSQSHLHGWCGWYHNSYGTYKLYSLLSRVKKTCLLSRYNSKNMLPPYGITHLPSLSSWLQTSPIDIGRDTAKSTELAYKRPIQILDGTNIQEMHTSIATVMDMPPNSCIQPGGYVVHPATLDAATHTAAALVIIPTHGSIPSTLSTFVAQTALSAF